MANRWMNQFFHSLERKKVILWANAAIGAAGAVTMDAVKSKGIASIVKSATGTYTITLQDGYSDLFHIDAKIVLAAGAPAVLSGSIVRSFDVVSAKTIVIAFLDDAGADVNPDSGSTLLIEIKLKNTGV
jgi:hypothetical protein